MAYQQAKFWLVAICATFLLATPGNGSNARQDAGIEYWTTGSGSVTFHPSPSLSSHGINISIPDGAFQPLELDPAFEVTVVSYNEAFHGILTGGFQTQGDILVTGINGNRILISDLFITPPTSRTQESEIWSTDGFFDLLSGPARLDLTKGELHLDFTMLISNQLARDMGQPSAGGALAGTMHFKLMIYPFRPANPDPFDFNGQTASRRPLGPDVIVGNVYDPRYWGRLGDINAYSLGTESCNIGDTDVLWISQNRFHPVIAQNFYRLKEGRFEQIGQSWLKHSFAALANTLCDDDCQNPGTSTLLGVHCSDPYSGGLNGSRSRLGPRFEVNASTGFFNYPPYQPDSDETIGRRLQIHDADIDPALNAGAIWIGEGQYVTEDDALAGNALNNASWRRFDVTGTAPTFNIVTMSGEETHREEPAIYAWPAHESDVVLSELMVDEGAGLFGLIVIGSKATDLGGGMWHYEYAVQNVNSHRSVGAFTVDIPTAANISNAGFHDVDYHSGEPYDLTDWRSDFSDSQLNWATIDYATDPLANAIRWGTLYNFRFDTDRPPEQRTATLGLFRPGTPDALTIEGITVPGEDCNVNNIADSQDIAAGNSEDINANGIPDECEVVIAHAGGPYIGNAHKEVTFDASLSAGADLLYQWDWTNDGSWDTGWLTDPIISHTYSAEFHGQAKLQVKDSGENFGTDTADVDINPVYGGLQVEENTHEATHQVL